MARIRTIKPEFPHSESMGNVSREARLTFVLLFTVADDSGRTRGSSRLLASLLFPYDDDAPGLIDGWLAELQTENCIVLYEHDGTRYLEICNWLEHQKIDKPSKSRFPEPREGSRILSKPRENSPRTVDLVPSILDRGPGTVDRGGDQDILLSPEGDERDTNGSMTAVEFFERWNRWAKSHGMQAARKLTDERRAKINTRLKHDGWLADFREALNHLPLPGKTDNDWQPDLDWMIANDKNVLSVLEGKFNWRAGGVVKSRNQPLIERLMEEYADDTETIDGTATQSVGGNGAG